MNTKHALLLILLFFANIATALDKNNKRYLDRVEVRDFIETMVKEHKLNKGQLNKLFRDAVHQQQVIAAYQRPAERSLSWKKYRKMFIRPARITQGVKFYHQHRDILAAATLETKVPAALIVAIIGVESRYGKHKGKNPVFDSLVTLAFDREKRSAFFKKELQEYLLLCQEQGFEPTAIKGSYAGAMGMPQFIASSYRNYALDGDKDGKIDLFNNHRDVIASVANYFKRHHWRGDQPVVAKAIVKRPQQISANIVGKGRKGLKPVVTWQKYRSQGVKSSAQIADDELLTLMYFDDEKSGEYWLAYHNFYVITRYNQSIMYALAVLELAAEIEQSYRAQFKP